MVKKFFSLEKRGGKAVKKVLEHVFKKKPTTMQFLTKSQKTKVFIRS